MTSDNTTEQQLLEMADHMKELVEQKDTDLRKMKELYMDGKKTIGKLYGLIRILQENADELEDGYYMEWVVGEIRRVISDYLFSDEEKKLDIYGY
tara:strand:- start:2618 stop:2902 length:285 start_codon:yes stop_codon:yes gene_type:complete